MGRFVLPFVSGIWLRTTIITLPMWHTLNKKWLSHEMNQIHCPDIVGMVEARWFLECTEFKEDPTTDGSDVSRKQTQCEPSDLFDYVISFGSRTIKCEDDRHTFTQQHLTDVYPMTALCDIGQALCLSSRLQSQERVPPSRLPWYIQEMVVQSATPRELLTDGNETRRLTRIHFIGSQTDSGKGLPPCLDLSLTRPTSATTVSVSKQCSRHSFL